MQNKSYQQTSSSLNNMYFGIITEENLRNFLKGSNFKDIEHLGAEELYYFWVDRAY